MKILNALILAASVVCLGTGAANAGKLTSCEFNGKPLHGKVQIQICEFISRFEITGRILLLHRFTVQVKI